MYTTTIVILGMYTQNNGSHLFYGAATGSADAVITFSEFLRLNTTGAVFNEGDANLDFRVESENNINTIFVDGENDIVSLFKTPSTGTTGAEFRSDGSSYFTKAAATNAPVV